MREERRGTIERVAIAINSKSLASGQIGTRGSGIHATMLAAVGGARLHILHGADRRGVTIFQSLSGEKRVDPRDLEAADLAPTLLRIRDAGRLSELRRAVESYSRWLALKPRFSETKSRILLRFSARAVYEWLYDGCPGCSRTGKQERRQDGSWGRPTGTNRGAVFRDCTFCFGRGILRPDNEARVRALRIRYREYKRDGWRSAFEASRGWLDELVDGRLAAAVEHQLGRRR